MTYFLFWKTKLKSKQAKAKKSEQIANALQIITVDSLNGRVTFNGTPSGGTPSACVNNNNVKIITSIYLGLSYEGTQLAIL